MSTNYLRCLLMLSSSSFCPCSFSYIIQDFGDQSPVLVLCVVIFVASISSLILSNLIPDVLKRYPEPMAHGPEACEPSQPLTPAVSGISLFSNPRNLESDF